MFKANDKNGCIVSAVRAKKNEFYYCRCCDERVSYVSGDLSYKYGKSPHFRHFPNCVCSDTWRYYDKTQWHRDWQDCFPIEKQEVILESEGKKHIADVLIEDHKTVIEFQHSYISPEEFFDRNSFYNSFGYKVIWVFDVQDYYSNGKIGKKERGFESLIEGLYWDNPIKCLREYHLSDSVDIFLQISGPHDETGKENNEAQLLRIARSDPGFKSFYAPSSFSEKDFLSFVYQPDDLRKYRYTYKKEEADRFGDMKYIGMDSSGQKTVLGCPVATQGEGLDLSQCRDCPFHVRETRERVHCLKQYLSLTVSEASFAKDVVRDKLDQIKIIELSLIPCEKTVVINEPIGKALKEIWNEYSTAGVIILLNLYSGSMIKMCRSWFQAGIENDDFMCEIKMKGHKHFMKERRPLLYADRKQYAVLWWAAPKLNYDNGVPIPSGIDLDQSWRVC